MPTINDCVLCCKKAKNMEIKIIYDKEVKEQFFTKET